MHKLGEQLGAWIEAVIERHLFFRRLTLVGALAVCGWTTYQIFVDVAAITAAAASAYGIATGLLGVAVGFYFKERGK